MEALVYTSIPSFSDFSELTNKQHYHRLPSDWCVLVSDVVGSTDAIEAGRYRDVNTIGAACVAAVKNTMKGQEFPYVFGGDGATMVVPCTWRDSAVDALLSLRRLTKTQFHLDLRVGVVTVGELEENGASVEVARYELKASMCIALFRGGGLAMADTIVKSELLPLQDTKKSNEMEPSLDGLSCRWNAIPNKRGTVVSLLVSYAPENTCGSSTTTKPDATECHVYADVLEELNLILNGRANQGNSISNNNPVNLDKATCKGFRQMIKEERRFHLRKWSPSFAARVALIALCHVMFRKRYVRNAILAEYEASMAFHADYRKFDDMLRMVIDCTVEQSDDIERMLEARYQDGELNYGIHRGKSSLMTCLVEEVTEGQHIHFIDGDDGGYAMAAKGLKAQLKKAALQKNEKRGKSSAANHQ